MIAVVTQLPCFSSDTKRWGTVSRSVQISALKHVASIATRRQFRFIVACGDLGIVSEVFERSL